MAQTFLHDRQHRLAGLDEDHPVGLQSGARQAGSEQVRLAQHPQDRPIESGQQAGDE
jgi:hypothetical protein